MNAEFKGKKIEILGYNIKNTDIVPYFEKSVGCFTKNKIRIN